jgi:YihY family inner membrane protein
MPDPMAILSRVLDVPRVVEVRAVLDTYGRAAGGLLANGLAFATMFAAIPTLLLVLGLAGFVAGGDTGVRDAVSQVLIAAFPPLEDLIDSALDAITKGAAAASVLGVIGLVWTVSNLYGALDVAFARIYTGIPERDMVRRTARGFLVVGLLAVAIIGLVLVAGLAAALDSTALGRIPLAQTITTLATSWPTMIVIAILGVLIVYRTLPPRAPSLRAEALPAILVGTGIVILTQLFTFLVPRLVGVAALAGSLASAFIALAWLSFSFQALLYGAAWVRIRQYGVAVPHVTPEESAAIEEGAADVAAGSPGTTAGGTEGSGALGSAAAAAEPGVRRE